MKYMNEGINEKIVYCIFAGVLVTLSLHVEVGFIRYTGSTGTILHYFLLI